MGHKHSKRKKGKNDEKQEHDDEHDELGHILEGVPKKPVHERMSHEQTNLNKDRTGSQIRKAIVPNKDVGARLREVPIFARLDAKQRAHLGGALAKKIFKSGEFVFKEGDVGEAFYIVVGGRLEVSRNAPGSTEEKDVVVLATLEVGDYFGEASLLSDQKRTATVKAIGEEDVTVLFLAREEFEALFIGEENNDKIVVPWATRRAAIRGEDTDAGQEAIMQATEEQKEKTEDEKEFIRKALTNEEENAAVFFKDLPTKHLDTIINEMYKVNFSKSTAALKKDVMNYCLYIVASGSFEEKKEDEDAATHGEGSVFGAVALIDAHEQKSVVEALEDSTCWAIDRFKYKAVSRDVGQNQLTRYQNFLSSIDLLAPLSSFERSKIAEALTEQVIAPGVEIFKQGVEGDFLYILEEGKVKITQEKEGETVELVTYKRGGYFGEKALLQSEKRAATATAGAEGCTVVKIDRAAFNALLGPLETLFNQRIASYEKKKKEKKVNWVPLGLDFGNWVTLGTLGKGSFGFVTLVQGTDKSHTESFGKYYALKAVSKYTVKKTKQEGHIMNEKMSMVELHHPCLVNLVQTYNSKDELFFLLEAGMGGDLFTALRRNRLFDERTAKFFAASVIAGFGFMHSKDYVYRDLKPENLLLDDLGFLKITDFGFAKKISGKTWTLCGTPEYLAPEIVAGRGHGFGVDWWTCGILIYELLAGYTPFYDRDQMLMYRKIARGKFNFPSHMSTEARAIVGELLTPQPTARLGVTNGGWKMIKGHNWFKGFDWAALVMRKLKPPIKPTIKSKKNLSREQAKPPTPFPIAAKPEDDPFFDF